MSTTLCPYWLLPSILAYSHCYYPLWPVNWSLFSLQCSLSCTMDSLTRGQLNHLLNRGFKLKPLWNQIITLLCDSKHQENTLQLDNIRCDSQRELSEWLETTLDIHYESCNLCLSWWDKWEHGFLMNHGPFESLVTTFNLTSASFRPPPATKAGETSFPSKGDYIQAPP